MSITSVNCEFNLIKKSKEHTNINYFSLEKKSKPLKKILKGLNKKGGRNNKGRITFFQQGGGHKRKSRRIINLLHNDKGYVETIEYDPNRTSFINRIRSFKSGKSFYILGTKGLKRGSIVNFKTNKIINKNLFNISSKNYQSLANDTNNLFLNKNGSRMLLKDIPIGSLIHNISLYPEKKGQLALSAGTYGQLIQKILPEFYKENKHKLNFPLNNIGYAQIRLKSKEERFIPLNCEASLGIVSNENHFLKRIGKAGRNRWLNKRSNVRGVAMNPIDHPHGGGEGKTSGGRPSVTPWGKPTKGKPTVLKIKKNKLRIIIKDK